jgi:hypothetical protein
MAPYFAANEISLTPAKDGNGHIIPNCWEQGRIIPVKRNGVTVMRVLPSRTDLASVPRPFWIFTGGKTGRHQPAAVCHDYAYRKGLMTREQCDQMFYDIMLQYGTSKFRAWIMWKGVRLGGKQSYKD